MKCFNRECEDADNSSSGCKRLRHAMDKYCDNYVAEATPPPKQSGTMARALAITPYERACFIIRAFGNKSLEPHFNTIRNHVDKLTQEKAEMERALEMLEEAVTNLDTAVYGRFMEDNEIEWDIKAHFISKAQQEEGK